MRRIELLLPLPNPLNRFLPRDPQGHHTLPMENLEARVRFEPTNDGLMPICDRFESLEAHDAEIEHSDGG